MNRDGIKVNTTVLVLAPIFWLVLYFTILWRLPFVCNLNRVKLPDGCKEIETDVIWTSLEIMHIKAERVFSSKSSREQLEDYINKNNSSLGRITFGWWSCPEYDHADAVSPEDHPELPWDGTETYYVLTYSTWGTSMDQFVFLAGCVFAVLIGLLVFFLSVKPHRKKMEATVISLAYKTGWCNLWITLFLGAFTFLHFGLVVAGLLMVMTVMGTILGINGKKRGKYRIVLVGMGCSYLGLCLAVGGFFVHLLIVCG